MAKLPIMETFLSVQGEGYHQGKLSYFIRLAGCDVGCSWCDVKESWEVSEDQYLDVTSICQEALSSPAELIIITGGEPLMYDLSELTELLQKAGKKVHLETSGAYEIKGSFDWICLSPKKFKNPLPEIYQMADELKVIVVNKNDFIWGEKEAEKVSPNCKLFLQAEWDKREVQNQSIYSYIAQNPKWRISVQTHKYLGLP